jgi:hypothetical protein
MKKIFKIESFINVRLVLFTFFLSIFFIPACVKDKNNDAVEKSTSQGPESLSVQVLNGTASVSELIRARSRGEGGGVVVIGDPAPAVCYASLTVNDVFLPGSSSGAWGIAVAMLDDDFNPIGNELLVGNCPSCNPQIQVGESFSFPVPLQGSRFDILFIPDGSTESTIDVTEFPPCGWHNTVPLFYGDDIYGHWYTDLHQFGTLLSCDCT